MNKYCENHKSNERCRLTNRAVSDNFCSIVCKQRPELYHTKSLDQRRDEVRKPLTKEQANNEDCVSVIIPAGGPETQYLDRTVANVKENAVGPIEILVDVKLEGAHVKANRMARKAKGKYLLRLDAHCAMSKEWDARMKASCGPASVISPMIDSLDTETWTSGGRDEGLVVLDQRLRPFRPINWKMLEDRDVEEETMSLKTCCFMLEKDYYWRRGGCETASKTVCTGGAEWAFKVWLTGGEILLRTDVVCYHLFRKTPYNIDYAGIDEKYREQGERWRSGKGEGQTRSIEWLLDKFKEYLDPTICYVPSRAIKSRE